MTNLEHLCTPENRVSADKIAATLGISPSALRARLRDKRIIPEEVGLYQNPITLRWFIVDYDKFNRIQKILLSRWREQAAEENATPEAIWI